MTKKSSQNGRYNSAQMDCIKDALKKYAFENAIKSSFYHMAIMDVLGFGIERPILNANDPKNWFKGHTPSPLKLELYAQFVQKVYPELQVLGDAK